MRLVLWAVLLASNFAHAAPAYRLPAGQVGCSKMVESFCDTLWAPEALGNLSLQTPEGKPLGEVTLGKMPNETTFANTFFAQAQLDAKSRLPVDLRAALEKRGYFEKLDRFVNHKPFSAMTRSEVELFRALYGQIDAIAGESLSNTASTRVSKKHPGFFRLTDDRVPTHIAHDYNRAKDELEASVWKAIWSSHPRWSKLQAEFEEIRSVFLELIRAHPSASKPTRERWETRIKATRLELPGTDPVQLGEAERRCASTEMNGYHSIERNTVTLCGGYILASDPARTLAHELAHTLGQRRSEFQARAEHPLAARLRALRESTCKGAPYGETPVAREPLGCEAWKKWKEEFSRDMGVPISMTEQTKEFLGCLTTKKLKGEAPAATLDYIARDWVQSGLEIQARRDRFIRLTKETEILRDGSTHPSPSYLNPCGIYYIYSARDPYSPDFTLNTFFVNEYRCVKEVSKDGCKKRPEECLDAAIQGADALEYSLRRYGLGIQTRYSSVRDLQRQGYAEDIEEDLADNLGQQAYARYLSRKSSEAERRAKFLLTVASLCDEPSIAKLYPAEAQVQKKYYIDSHSEGLDRRRKLLIRPVREVLGCEMDFPDTFKECDWYRPD